MASTSANLTSSSAIDKRRSNHVFLSFSGKDTRHNFISHLLRSLKQLGINAFFDEEGLDRGEQIKPALLKAIEGSMITVVVFSENYASSSWCLDELSKIVECSKSRGQTLIPIFYKVEPTVIRKQELRLFQTALEKHDQEFSDNQYKVQKWRDALFEASNLAGEHFNDGNEADFVEKIVQLVSKTLDRRPLLHVAKNPVGLDSEIEKVKPLLRIGEPEVRFIGIVGIGGIGKTTLAKAIYNQFAEGYEGWCFLENVREASQENNKLIKLQEQLLSDLLGGKKIDVSSVSSGITFIKDRLQNRRCLIVLDDVDKPLYIEILAGGCDWFGLGSHIIVTTRDEHLLVQVGASIYRMEGLCDDHARELLSLSAFREPSPPTDYAKVFSTVLDYSKGLPLALTVLGSFLYGRDVSHWRSTIQRLKDIPNKEICEVLQISYDGLDEEQKAIFLYIACFFKRKKAEKVIKILNGCGYHSEIGIRVLLERSLITIQHGWMCMHDLVQEMGKDIARREKSKLWTLEEIHSVLEDNTGTDAVQAIYLRLQHPPRRIFLDPKAFKGMKKLHMLIVEYDHYEAKGCDHFSCGPEYLPSELRLLKWDGYPSLSLPHDFNPRCLIMLILSGSKINKLWEGKKLGPKLMAIDLSESKSLLEIPDVSGMPNLKELRANRCKSLIKVHDSVGYLEKLEFLSFEDCTSLRNLPTRLGLPSLQYLSLKECDQLKKFPDILGRMECIETLDLYGTSIKELPPSMENLTGLRILNLSFNSGLEALPRFIYYLPNLKKLYLDYCNRLHGFMEKEEVGSSPSSAEAVSCLIGSLFPNLVYLYMKLSNIISLSPCISRCYNLDTLGLSKSKQLKEIPQLPPRLKFLDVRGCESLETVESKVLLEWLKGHEERLRKTSFPQEDSWEDEAYHFQALIPRRHIPDRFYQGRIDVGENRLDFRVHSRVLKELVGFTLFAAFSKEDYSFPSHKWLMLINGKEVYAQERGSYFGPDNAWIVYHHLKKQWEEHVLLLDGWNQFSFVVEPDDVKSCGASFISKSGEDLSSSTEIEFLSPKRDITNHEDTKAAMNYDENTDVDA